VNFISRLAIAAGFATGTMLFATTIPISNTGTIGTGCIGTVTLAGGCTLMSHDQTGDSHYTITSAPGGSTTQTVAITGAGGGFPIGATTWLVDNNTSTWLRPNNGSTVGGADTDPVGTYVWEQTFTLPSVGPSTVIVGRWASDNEATFTFNGNVVGSTPIGVSQFTQWHSFTINSGFVAGLNTLQFTVNNRTGPGRTPTGLRVEFSQAFLPEPTEVLSSVALLGAALAVARRRRATA